ncbi:helix-turn-helix domain-containing protein [Desulfovibrio porci]|uniref:helix-turn-helix transcriptional regulator n=1 Tax=Desulfovibrio porci TaxID=2605782 RepID=UPI002A826706|nr:helix-turn-helix domain-containing protein [Desulfovibrio porci]MDY3811007.1 helix-turn-helix domain-containing protein [Desulfovibrio porci]
MAVDHFPLAQQPSGSMRKRILLNTAQAAEFLSLSPITLNIMRSECRGPAYLKFGRTVRYDAADLEVWLESRRIDPEKL